MEVFFPSAIFFCKRKILLRMDELDPGGGWLENGA